MKTPPSFPPLALPITPPYPPMEAERASTIPTGEGWLFEPKWDGFRALVFRDREKVVIQSKAGQPLERYFPELTAEFLNLAAPRFVLDGEIVVPVDGRLSFDDLLQRIHPAASRVRRLAEETPARYFAFDLLVEPRRGGGRSLAERALCERRERLETFFSVFDNSALQLSPTTTDRRVATAWLEQFGELGLDGVMAKRVGEPYHSGDREGMVKIKHFHTADCVVGGFRYTAGTRLVGSLLLGLYDKDGYLVFIGHASSFSQAKQKELKEIVEPLIAKNPFSVRVPGGPTRWATNKTGEWTPTRPKLVCEVEYDYFSQGRFRHGSRLIRWRPDKRPDQCTMDQIEPRKKKDGKVLSNLGME